MLKRADVLSAIEAMRFAGLRDFGRFPRDTKGLAAMAMVWHDRLVANGVTLAELKAVVTRLCDSGGDFPSLGSVLDEVAGSRPFMRDPVVVGIENGVPRYGERGNYLPSQIVETAAIVGNGSREGLMLALEKLDAKFGGAE